MTEDIIKRYDSVLWEMIDEYDWVQNPWLKLRMKETAKRLKELLADNPQFDNEDIRNKIYIALK
jgi:hypothetical protein